MKHLRRFLFTTILCSFLLCESVLAYDTEHYYRNQGGIWEVDNRHNNPVHIVMYEFTQNTVTLITTADWYPFACTEGEFPNGKTQGVMAYYYNGLNGEAVDTLEGNPIWKWEFAIEPGTYAFSNTYWERNKCTLLSDLSVPEYTDIGDGIIETFELVDGDVVRLYVLNGSVEWINENTSIFQDWANENEKLLQAAADAQYSGEKEVIVVEESTESVEENKPTPSPTVTQSPKVEIPSSDQPVSQSEDSSSEVASNMWVIYFWIGAILVIGVLLFVISRKFRN